MAWRYGVTETPITHETGEVPERPLEPGDYVRSTAAHITEYVTATTDTLLQLETPGRKRIAFRAPIEGDYSGVITSMERRG